MKLEKIFDQYWQDSLAHSPSMATIVGLKKYNDRLEDYTLKSSKKGMAISRGVVQKLKEFKNRDLDLNEQISKSMFVKGFELSKDFDRYPLECLAVNQMSSFYTGFLTVVRVHPFDEAKDFEDYLSRLGLFLKVVRVVRGHLRKGLKTGWTLPAHIAKLVENQLKGMAASKPEESPFFQPAVKFLESLDCSAQASSRERLKKAVKKVLQALSRLGKFVGGEYHAGCRKGEGLCHLPDGQEVYKLYIRSHTGLDQSAEEIHHLGLLEVQRIRAQMEQIKDELGFAGSLSEFFVHMRGKKDLHYESREEIVQHHQDLLAVMDKKLPDYFGILPKNPYELKPLPSFQEKEAPDAFYMPGNSSTGRPGTYFVNTYEPSTRGRFNAEVLAYHEAVPGHHLQISIAQELSHLPEFRKWSTETAYVEGWALYTEKLSQEMGFYQDLYSQFGKLSFEIWRACRLVVDTGLHHFGWSRKKSIEFMLENSGLSRHNIEVEVDRYTVMPGQALSYKIGELFILELRKKIEERDGKNFDIKRFHDCLLKNGAVPLNLLEEVFLAEYDKG